MNATIAKESKFIITYDDGNESQTLVVTHEQFNEDELFRNHILHQKCLRCNFESNFEKEKPQ